MRTLVVSLFVVSFLQAGERRLLQYAPAPVDNPLKGLVPYEGDVRARFPHSLEFSYLSYASLVKGYDEFDWSPMEKLLDRIASRGHQAVFRIYLEYPGKKEAIPEFLIKDGLKVHKWHFDAAKPSASNAIETPDYEDKNLRKSLANFLRAFGKKYDGDPRIGFVTAGLLGLWGEWHNFPKSELFARKAVQAEVMDAYEAAFRITPVLLRYPAGETGHLAPNANRKFGYHDDSFAWGTLDTGRKADDWFYMRALNAAGSEAIDKWKTQPIGGEIRPEAWGQVFDEKPARKEIQDFRRCVEDTHVTWLMDSGMFGKNQPADRIRRATEQVRRMGYEFHAPAATITSLANGRQKVELEIENRGVAPFYADWKPEYALLQAGQPGKTWPGTGKLSGLLPGDRPRTWTDTIDLSAVKPGKYQLALRIPNPMKNGHPLKFANATQDADVPGWMSLGGIEVK
jgi:Domain of unknown function (DUF4832)